jgi:phage tail-like protein
MPTNVVAGERQSRYLQYLPAIYRDNKLMGQFLCIFEDILTPLERLVDNIPAYLDPSMAPEPFLNWLAAWLDLSLDPEWPEEKRRELVNSAAELYKWRGTRKGLSEYIRIYTGIEPEIQESVPAMKLDKDSRLGNGIQLGNGMPWYHFNVVLVVDKADKIEHTKLRSIIECQKPAHSTCSVQIKVKNRD